MANSRVAARRLCPVVLLLCAVAAEGAAQEPSPAAGERVRATGVVAGVVRNEAGAPLPGARVMIDGFARQARTGDDGRFLLEGVAPGVRVLIVRKLGSREARATLRVPADSAVNVAITLVPAPQQLPGVVVEGALFNQVAGLIIDERDRPIPNVMVEIVGLGRKFQTREDGGFLLVDLDPGHYLLQFRKQGYTVAQYGLHMVREIDRDFTVRLRPAGDSRLTPELAAVVALEANRRQSMKGARAAVISRDELARFKDAPLAAALLESPAGITLRETGSSCILINGHESTTIGMLGTRVSVNSGRRGPTSLGGGGSTSRVGGNRTPPGGSASMSGFRGGWLDFFKADEVEMVEIYPEGTDNSRTLCGRFPPSSGCSCPPDPAGIVIWLRQ